MRRSPLADPPTPRMPSKASMPPLPREYRMDDRTRCGKLRPRHIEVLRAVLEHGGARAAARALFLSPKTVNWYMTEIHRVTGVRGGRGSHAAAVACGRALGLRVVVVDEGRSR